MGPLKTGYELYQSNGSIDIKPSLKNVVAKLEERNPGKYSSFLSSLNKIKILLTFLGVRRGVSRAEVVRLVYFAMRVIDDMVDGDTPNIFPVAERNKIVQEKKKTALGIVDLHQEDLFDVLMGKILAKSVYVNETKQVIKGMEELMESMAFDARRIATWSENKTLEKKTDEDMKVHFHQLDVTGTIYSTAALFGLEPQMATEILEPLGNACRIAYTLMDLLEDPKQWLLNIPLEDLEKFGISDSDLDELVAAKSLADLPLSIRSWCAAMIAEMDLGVLNYQRNMSQHQIPLTYSNNPVLKYLYNLALRRLVLPKGYMGDIKAVRKRYSSIITEAYIRNSC